MNDEKDQTKAENATTRGDELKKSIAMLAKVVADESRETAMLGYWGLKALRRVLAAVSHSSEPSDVRRVFYGEACARGWGSTWAERFADLAVYLRLCGPDERRAPNSRNTSDDPPVADLSRSLAPPTHEELARVLAKDNGPCACSFDYPGSEFDDDRPAPPACCDARAVLDLIRSHKSSPDDPPVVDPAERARAVARELRRRGIFAARLGEVSFASEIGYEGVGVLGMNKAGRIAGMSYGFDPEDAPRSVKDLADEIQREEARRAAAWAGDEGSDG